MEVRHVIRDYDDKTHELVNRYLVRYLKKMRGKDKATRCIMSNTFSCAIKVLDQLRDVELHDVVMSVFVYCRDENYQFISREFVKCIETAVLDPDRFVMGLHPFYNNLAAMLKTPEAMIRYSEFLGLFMKLYHTKSQTGIMNPNVATAYCDLIMQSLDYLRPKKLDVQNTVVGISTQGEALIRPDYYAYQDLASLEWLEEVLVNKNPAADHKAFSLKYGYTESVYENSDIHRRIRNGFVNVKTALMPFINEYTYDILPTKYPNGELKEWLLLLHNVSLNSLKEKLKLRRRTLPANGVKVVFSDPTEEFSELLLKEIVKNDTVYLLYKVSSHNGDFSGYYDTQEQYFWSALWEMQNHEPYDYLQSMVLFCYAAIVLDDPDYSDEKFHENFKNFIFPIKAKTYQYGGKLKQTYNQTLSNRVLEDPERYEQKEILINGYIRKLPDGQKASDEAKARAKQLGYDLKEDETYVVPFTKQIFYLKKPEDEEK